MTVLKYKFFIEEIKKCPSLFFFFMSCFMFHSCIEKTEVEIPSLEEGSKLVVYGAITPGRDVNVFVAKTFPSSTDSIVAIEDVYLFNADVFLYKQNRDDSIRLQLTNDTVPYYSCSKEDIELLKGETYKLYISVDGYTPVVASTTIPENAAVWEDDLRLITISLEIDGSYYDEYKFIGSWKIPSGNKYQFVSTNFFFSTVRIAYGYNFNYNIKDSIALFESETFPTWESYEHSTCITLITADKHLYKYAENYIFFNEVTDDLHYNTDGMYLDLFRGIMPEYTNIKGGYGIFGSYLEDTQVIYESGN
ncbi:DUF4249 family protein [Maribellus maritimus]|uniref:DUF4249 family protein n=1 Tax=Maribellus maritimus TaxID=2870838 RepID=UPI001EEBCDD5|nr:DUF4249 family protein [Maribellus maritimus]MCG6191414.1 DUF4249 domain-containing protein [Maribellus maritimus]